MAWLAVYLFGQGLDRADKLGSVLGFLVSLVSLFLTFGALWIGWAAWRDNRSSNGSVPDGETPIPAKSIRRGKFDVRAGRDAYVAQEMTVTHHHNEQSTPPAEQAP
jgi:hypothetical protein